MLVSNLEQKDSYLPKDYINYDMLAGVGLNDILISNSDSFEKLNNQIRKK